MQDVKEPQAARRTAFIGCHIEHHAQVGSTNDLAMVRGKHGSAEGTVIRAEHQTAGRGRYGRHWQAPPGKSLLVSVILRHRLLREQIALPNLIGAIAIAQAIRTREGLDAQIKVPNDVRIHKKKVAGVLTELAYDTQHRPFFVLGFGVNVHTDLADFPTELRDIATSVRIEHAQNENRNAALSRSDLLCDILFQLETFYRYLKTGQTDLIMNRFEELREDESGR